MKSFQSDHFGPPEVYGIKSVPVPEPLPGTVRVRVRAVGLGYGDVTVAAGRHHVKMPLPFTPGVQLCGDVDAVGEGAEAWKPGQRVIGLNFEGGGLAEYVLVDQSLLVPVPKTFSYVQGAAFRVNYATALAGLKNSGLLKEGETLFILGASGGIGTAAVQTGKAMGARVIAGASTQAKRDFALQHGADETVDYTQPSWREQLSKLTDGRGIDVVYDPVMGPYLDPAFRSLRWRGRYVIVGFVGGEIPSLKTNLPLIKGASLTAVEIRQFMLRQPQDSAENDRILNDWADAGLVTPTIAAVYSLDQAADALAHAGGGAVLGNIVVEV